MSHNRDSDFDQPPGGLRDLSAAFDFYGRRSAFLNEASRIAHGFFEAELESQKRHVRDDQCALDATAHGGRVMDHHVQCYWKRIVKAENDHAGRIADQYDVDAGAVQ